MPSHPVIALLTDFGLRDHYVGVLKGVLASHCPEATAIDITHEVPPQDVGTAALELAAAAPYFPPRTVFLVVVDPGVGTRRPAIAAQVGTHRYIGPDNGVFDLVFRRDVPSLIVQLVDVDPAQKTVGRTFEGRDRFAPAAALLARGAPLGTIGHSATAWARLEWPAPCESAEGIDGQVVHVDRFGNLITNIERRNVDDVLAASRVTVDGLGPVRVVGTYGEGVVGEPVALLNSADRLEVAVVSGNAAVRFGLGRGSPVRVRRPA